MARYKFYIAFVFVSFNGRTDGRSVGRKT